ncbi:unnamed protein product, partial [Ectocarpus sp. 13 AM-2016]
GGGAGCRSCFCCLPRTCHRFPFSVVSLSTCECLSPPPAAAVTGRSKRLWSHAAAGFRFGRKKPCRYITAFDAIHSVRSLCPCQPGNHRLYHRGRSGVAGVLVLLLLF